MRSLSRENSNIGRLIIHEVRLYKRAQSRRTLTWYQAFSTTVLPENISVYFYLEDVVIELYSCWNYGKLQQESDLH